MEDEKMRGRALWIIRVKLEVGRKLKIEFIELSLDVSCDPSLVWPGFHRV